MGTLGCRGGPRTDVTRSNRVTVLLTGFEPFEGQSVNASWLAVEAVAADWSGPPLHVRRLPVSFAAAPVALLVALEETCPDLVVCVGEAGERAALEIERVAINVADARIPDNDGARPVDEAVVPDGPVAHLTGLPLRRCVDAATRAGVPAAASNTAGTFVCNAVFYTLAQAMAGTAARYGFVHVPRAPEQVPTGGMATSLAARGLTAVLDACLLA